MSRVATAPPAARVRVSPPRAHSEVPARLERADHDDDEDVPESVPELRDAQAQYGRAAFRRRAVLPDFWARVLSVQAVADELSLSSGRSPTLEPLLHALHGRGIEIDSSTLALCLFARRRLATLARLPGGLTGFAVKRLQPRLNALVRYAQAHVPSGLSEDDLYDKVFEPVFLTVVAHRHTRLNVPVLAASLEVSLCAFLADSLPQLRMQLALQSGASPQAASGRSAFHQTTPRQKTPRQKTPRQTGPRQISAARSAARSGAAIALTRRTAGQAPRTQGRRAGTRHDALPCSPPPAERSQDAGTGHARALAAHLRALPAGAGFEAQLTRFAAITGLSALVELDVQAPAGFWLRPLSQALACDPARRQPWSALALLTGADSPCALQVLSPMPELLAWLHDAGNPAARAFWGLMQARARSMSEGSMRAPSGSDRGDSSGARSA
jgi:hypothetical protein